MKTSILKIKVCGKGEFFEKVSEEEFYLVDITIDKYKVKARFSEYQLQPEGEYVVSCCIGSMTLEKTGKMFTFLDILTIEPLRELQTVPNDIFIGGIIVYDAVAAPDHTKCDTAINFAVIYNSGIKDVRRNVVHCRLSGKEARRLQKLEKGKVIELKGQLSVAASGSVSVIVSDILLLEDNPNNEAKAN